MTNTKKSFYNKWKMNPTIAIKETLDIKSNIFSWILNRNGFKNQQDFRTYLSTKKRILDAGCGNGRVTALLREYSNPLYTEIVGCDIISDKIAQTNLSLYRNVHVYKKDLLKNLSDLGKFDFIYCQEVLHHTKKPQKAFNNLVSLLNKKGEIAIYVYRKKAPVREYVDLYIRNKISSLSYSDAMKVCEQITSLGKILSEKKIKITVPSVDILEIEEGTYDLQRFFYHFFMKCFWSREFSFNDNAVINYDWYHPENCSKHTLKEIRQWFHACSLKITHENVDHYGITVRGRK